MFKYYGKYAPYLFLLPAAIVLVIFFFIPFFQTFLLSFMDYSHNIYEPAFIGLENYMNLSANYARTLSDKLFFMSFKTIRQKLASYLLRLYKQQQQTHITLDRSQQELSDYFGVSRPSLARELAHMQEDGLLIADRKHITILQKEQLVRLIQ